MLGKAFFFEEKLRKLEPFILVDRESFTNGPKSLEIVVGGVQCLVTVTSNVKVTFYVTVLFQVRKVPNSPKKTQKVLKSLKKS